MSRTITLNTGEKIEIRNTDGELMGYFYFNPADPKLIEKCDAAQKEIEKMMKETGEHPSLDDLHNINMGLQNQMEMILGKSASDTLFRYNSPLAVMQDGRIYGVYAFETVCNFVRAELLERFERSKEQAAKYTAKYQ